MITMKLGREEEEEEVGLRSDIMAPIAETTPGACGCPPRCRRTNEACPAGDFPAYPQFCS